MATTTVVCPECGAAAAPGRFACPDCGALVASLGPARRRPAARRAQRPLPRVTVEDERHDDKAEVALEAVSGAAGDAIPDSSPPIVEPEPVEPAEPDWARAPEAAEPQWPVAPIAPEWRSPSTSSEPPVAAEPAMGPSQEVPAWPPVPDPAPIPEPVVRTPAGAYLAPSAVLPPLDAPSVASARHVDPTSDTLHGPGGKPRVTTLSETLDAFGITGDVPRRVVGSGAALAALGFLLPWAEVVIGSGLSGSYWARWGMAGPGHWVVVATLIVVAVLGLTRGRHSEVPLGAPALGLGALLVGLVWPYLFGVIGHSVGVWLVLVGAIILSVGGFLDLRRHATARPDV